jgi:hypothetical protein
MGCLDSPGREETMKQQLIVAGVALAAAGALGLAIPAADNARHDEVALVDTSYNDLLLQLEGASTFTSNAQPLGDEATSPASDFYNVAATDDGGMLSGTGATDLLNSTDVIGANQLFGLGDTNGYIGLSPTDVAGDYTFTDQEGVAFDHGLQALLTGFNASTISYEETLSSTTTYGDPSLLNLDPAQLTTTAAASLSTDLTTAYNDFVTFYDLAFNIAP